MNQSREKVWTREVRGETEQIHRTSVPKNVQLKERLAKDLEKKAEAAKKSN